MSLPWSRSVHLEIAPRRISAVLARGWPVSRQLATSTRTSEGAAPPAPTSQLDIEQLEAVLEELDASGPVRGARYSVELADALVHFDVAEGQFATQTDRELQSIAAACIDELLGEGAAAYEVRWSLQTGGRHLFIAAVPKACLSSLTAAAAKRDSVLASVQPAFCRQWNAFARLLKARVAIFAVTSGMHVVVACVVAGAVCGISVGPWTRTEVAEPKPAGTGGETVPQSETSLLIERRATRLFASLGIELEGDPQFILVTPDPGALLASPPWTVVQTSTEAS